MKSSKQKRKPESESPRRLTRLREKLATNNLLFFLPILFLLGTLALWQWSSNNERERIRMLTVEEASRIARELAEVLQGQAEASLSSGNRWLLRVPDDQNEWDRDLLQRRGPHPELETVEWLDADLVPLLWPTEQQPQAGALLGSEDLALAAAEHRVVLAGPLIRPERDPVTVTIVPLERSAEPVGWIVSIYNLGRVFRSVSQGSNIAFAVAVLEGEQEVYGSYSDDRPALAEWERSVTVGYDQLGLEVRVWPRAATLERFRTRMPEMALIGGLLATVTLALGIRLAQVSSRRAIESRMTASLQKEVRARKLAEQSLERKLQELSRSNQEFERFAYAISHDLRDPLNAIHLNVQSVLMQAGDDLEPHARQRLEHGKKAVGRLDAMISRLLEYARAGGGVNGLELIDSQAALDEAIANLQGVIDRHGASVVHGKLPKVIAHRAALARLFQNLVSNAVKYRGEDPPEVIIEAVRGDDEWVFAVADNARGMTKREIKRAFDLFWRHEGGDDAGGEGIGLAVCKRIVERQGGRIWIESSPGEGTTFFFSWPADPDASSAQRRVSDRE